MQRNPYRLPDLTRLLSDKKVLSGLSRLSDRGGAAGEDLFLIAHAKIHE